MRADRSHRPALRAPMKGALAAILALTALSATVSAAANPPGPAAFSGVSLTGLTANWTANGNANGTTYYVILSTGASPGTNNFLGNISSATLNLQAVFSGLSINTTYFADVA